MMGSTVSAFSGLSLIPQSVSILWVEHLNMLLFDMGKQEFDMGEQGFDMGKQGFDMGEQEGFDMGEKEGFDMGEQRSMPLFTNKLKTMQIYNY